MPSDDQASSANSSSDRVLRAITDDDTFRVITASTTQLVTEALQTHSVSGQTADHFGAFLTGTVLIRETMAPDYRVQGVLKGVNGRGTLTADSYPDGLTRGLVELPADMEHFEIGAGSVLQMMRMVTNGRVSRGLVQPPDKGTVAQALMTYMQESEQVVSVIRMGIRWQNDAVQYAGGFVIQLLPDADRGALMIMTERLEALPTFESLLETIAGCPRALLDELLYGMSFAQLDDRPVHYGCNCSRESVIAALSTIDRNEIAEMLDEQETLTLDCDYCKQSYRIGRAHLQGLLRSS